MMTNTILAIETATSACSAAITVNGQTTQLLEVGNNIHSKLLLQMVSDLLQQAEVEVSQLNAVAVGQGPGSFTGLRIGVGVAQGIAYGAGCPMIGISSLDALANQATKGRVIAAVDARMGEVYWCEYELQSEQLLRISSLQVSKPELIESDFEDEIQILGNAWKEYEDQFSPSLKSRAKIVDEQKFPQASSLLVLAERAYQQGELISPIDFAPEYVRNDVAKKSVKKSLLNKS